MTRYAAETTVPVEKSRAEIESILRRYGADGFRYGCCYREDVRREQIDFPANDRLIRFTLSMPSKDDKQFMFTPTRRNRRSEKDRIKAWEQACRQRWRALALCIKAKLEAVECGISEFESEFLAFVVDPSTGRTIGETVRPQIESVYASGGGQIRLPGLPSPEDFETPDEHLHEAT